MKQEYLLSICMMVKDEEKNLGRCLDSLKPLLEKDDVELIVVDTGSSDRTPEIARRYTDKVYYHLWNNDFSSMRNITISYAKGMYLLILDADEKLNDPLLLYEYMNDPRLRTYNTYLLKIRSYNTFESFTVISQERVFRNDGEFRYEGAVHNQALFKKPVLGTDIYVDHYGYLFQDSGLREKKFKRTASILRSELEKNPANPYYRFQLARSLSVHKDTKEALEEIRRAYGLISGDTRAMRLYCYIYGPYSIICCENGEFDEAIKVCREGLEVRPEYADLYFIMARALAKLDRKPEAAEAYGKYLDLVERYDKLDISRDRSMEMCYTGASHKDSALVFIANEFMAQGKYIQAKKYIIKINDDKARVALLVKALLKLKEFGELARIYRKHLENKQISRSIADIVEMEKKSLNADYRQKIEEAFCMDGNDPYLMLNRIRRAEDCGKPTLMENALRQVDFGDLPDYYAEMMSCIDVNTRLVISTLKKLNKTKIKQYAKHLMDIRPQLEDFFEKYLAEEQVRSGDSHGLRVYISIAYAYLYAKAQIWRDMKLDPPESCYSIFKLYIQRGIEYISLLYNRERLRLYYDTLEDHEDRFFIALGYAAEAVEREDFRSGIRYFREAAKAYPYMGCYMNKYKDELFQDPEITGEEEM
ncbi:MAG: glycosyltransferase [Bacillota bacterium]